MRGLQADMGGANSKARTTVLAAVLVVLGACAQPDQASLPGSAAIDSLASAALSEGPIAGLSIAVARGGELVFERGYGVTDVDAGTPASGATAYNIASTAKILAAAAIMRLVDAGSLSLDDSLGVIWPEVPNVEAIGHITVRQLLNMTSGLSDYVGADLERLASSQEPLTQSFVLDYVREHPLLFEPGAHWMYTNTGFYLAGIIVERVSGRPWGEFVLDEIVVPLGLEDTRLCDDVAESRSRGYEISGDTFIPSLLDAERGVRGDAGLCSSARDLARLPAALLRGDVISPAGVQAMLTQTRLNNGVIVDYGLGVSKGAINRHALWGHLGGSGSLVSTLAHYPDDDLSIAVLVNTRRATLGALALEGQVAEVVLQLIPEREETSVDPALAVDLVGEYVGDREGTRFEIRYDGTKLLRVPASNPDSQVELHPRGARTFGRSDWPYDRFVFQPQDGPARAFSVYYNGFFDGYYSRISNEH